MPGGLETAGHVVPARSTDNLAGRVGRAAGRERIETTVRSYLSDGRRVSWRLDRPDGWRVAVDAERADQELPPHVRARSGMAAQESGERLLIAWTQAEVMAKLTDTPILLRLRRLGLGLADLGDHAPIMLVTHLTAGVIVTVGSRQGEPPA